MRLARLLWLACALFLLTPACVLPSGWDARTNGGRYDPPPDDPFHSGQWGVEDMRSGSQNSLALRFGTDARSRENPDGAS